MEQFASQRCWEEWVHTTNPQIQSLVLYSLSYFPLRVMGFPRLIRPRK